MSNFSVCIQSSILLRDLIQYWSVWLVILILTASYIFIELESSTLVPNLWLNAMDIILIFNRSILWRDLDSDQHTPLSQIGPYMAFRICMYYFLTIGGQTVSQLYSSRTTYVFPPFDSYVLGISAIQQVRTKKWICCVIWHIHKGEVSKPLLGLRSGVTPWSRNQSTIQQLKNAYVFLFLAVFGFFSFLYHLFIRWNHISECIKYFLLSLIA